MFEKKNQKVSVVIPCYNYARFLKCTVKSLQEQTYQNWEAIIVDDGSTDDTKKIASNLVMEDPRVRYLHQQNSGTSAAKNSGIKLAQGDYLLFLDADDLITPNKLESHIRHFANNPCIDISYSRFRYFKDGCEDQLFTKLDLSSVKEWSKSINGRYKKSFPVFVKRNNMTIHAAMVRKALVEKVGFFNADMDALEDWDYWLRCILHGGYISFLDDVKVLALTRVHQSSATHNLDFSKYADRIYENILSEADRIRREGDEKFYSFIEKEMRRVAYKKESRLRRKKRDELQRVAVSDGLCNQHGFFGVVKEFGFLNGIRVYIEALARNFR